MLALWGSIYDQRRIPWDADSWFLESMVQWDFSLITFHTICFLFEDALGDLLVPVHDNGRAGGDVRRARVLHARVHPRERGVHPWQRGVSGVHERAGRVRVRAQPAVSHV
jgi:hypothetical protein